MHLLNLENFSAYLLPLLLVLALSFAIDSLKHRLGGILAPKPAILHSAPAIEADQVPTSKLVEFMHLLESLKLNKRLGWIECGISEEKVESIADHMYRMAIMAILFSTDTELDAYRCVKMALVHDMAEAITTDITLDSKLFPLKDKLETDAMKRIQEMLVGHSFADEAVSLWQEYVANETPEAQFVKDLDKTELIAQVVEYEKMHNINFDVWINNARPKIRNVALQQLADHLLLQRPEQFIHKPADLIKGNGHDNEAQNVEENEQQNEEIEQKIEEIEQQNEEIEAESPVENGNDKKDAVSVNDHSKLDVEPAENDINDAELNSAGHREDYEEEDSSEDDDEDYEEEDSSEDDDEDLEAESDEEINQENRVVTAKANDLNFKAYDSSSLII